MYYGQMLMISADWLGTFRSSTSVSLKAREVLILGQMPSYEERLIQMEAVLRSSVSSNYYGEQGTAPRWVMVFSGSRIIHSQYVPGRRPPKFLRN
jgi:hypothetical protein